MMEQTAWVIPAEHDLAAARKATAPAEREDGVELEGMKGL